MKSYLLIIALLTNYVCKAQTLDSLKLLSGEIPAHYKLIDKLLCKSVQPQILYDKPEMYAGMMGTVLHKDFQSFESKNDQGTILYIEYEKDITGWEGFLDGLLWGGNKPTKEHPEEYLIKKNILVIWSFLKKSEIKAISKTKVSAL